MRVKRGFKARRRRNKVLKRAKGSYGANSRCYSTAIEKNDRALSYLYRDRKRKKRDFRRLWIQRISAALKQEGSQYSSFIAAATKKGMGINRKVLAELAVKDKQSFREIVKHVGS